MGLMSLANMVLAMGIGGGEWESCPLRQKLLDEPIWEVGMHKTSVGTGKKPMFLELRISIKEEWDTSSEHEEFGTAAGHIHGDSEQAARM